MTIAISSNVEYTAREILDLKYGDEKEIYQLVSDFYDKNIKDQKESFEDYYLVGKLINILSSDNETEDLISKLSQNLTDQSHFSTFFCGHELIEIFQTLRPQLIKLYAEKTNNDFCDWFSK